MRRAADVPSHGPHLRKLANALVFFDASKDSCSLHQIQFIRQGFRSGSEHRQSDRADLGNLRGGL